MAEYIEREKACASIERNITDDSLSFYCDGRNNGLITALSLVENAPAADVRPERHGRWIINADGYYPYCSACSYEPKNGAMTNFCPACGARMDKKDGESDDN